MSVVFDHLMVMVADEAAAAQEFSQAGFTVTPRSELPGLANRIICFPSSASHAACFVELLAVERPEEVPPRIRSFVGSMLGPVAIVLAVPNLTALHRRLSENNISVFGPVEIRRQWTLPTGERLEVALDILIGEDNSLPFNWAAVQHHTVEHYQRTAFMSHPNCYGDLRGVLISVEDPQAVAKKMETLFGSAYRSFGAGAVVSMQNAQLLLLPGSPDGKSVNPLKPLVIGAIVRRESDCIDLDDLMPELTSPSGIERCFEVLELVGAKIFFAKGGNAIR